MKRFIYTCSILFALFISVFQVQAQNQWDVRLILNRLDCQNRQAWYTLEIKSSSEQNWALGDQNYRLFFDADLMTVNGVRSLLPETAYSPASIDENLKFYGQGQEEYSPLDNIDDHLGFLDFSIVQTKKSNPNVSATVERDRYLPVAELSMTVDPAHLSSMELKNALSMKFSRKETAGKFTAQYVVITEHDAPNHTVATASGEFVDLTFESGADARLAMICNQVVRNDLTPGIAINKNEIKELLNVRLDIYPNPAAGPVRYDTPGLELGPHEVLIYDQFNRLIASWKMGALNQEENTVDLEDLPSGVYLFMVRTEDIQLQKQLVKIVRD
ncbi:T9SS type A sorting domain-containing protein [Flavilitoribacter nigricans]|uniref:Secretion system C-terminal sorting domain-containing protein n=1 Tax=Flavilitoribacter nigricans (strain ATCC 23147 / DSM 23189 / NBRC 102662 / NCIMB 1420 / SS-2) TaxID=1122177 RepID=A0A2D0NGJ1_FLAN2|nr:T9SS type A sorting domain-containing protein [Flavilitoribacter nigricans]PHN06873.1 hypothetical protein CRP01_09290 [Flavilitoribacter nigricans DSM 23189 = NBRC 102662]